MDIFFDFSNWLDKHLAVDLPDDVAAINFNLYEGSENTYDIELMGAPSFDEDDEDWACNASFSTLPDLFFIPITSDIAHWENGLLFITALIDKYIQKGKYAYKLKRYAAVSVGFVDGNITILYHAN